MLSLATGLPAALAQQSPQQPQQPQQPQATLSIERAIAAATQGSPLVGAADAQTRAAREMAAAAGELPDPVLKFGVDNLPINGADRFSLTRDFMTMRSVGVMQELTRADKRSARAQRAEGQVALAQATRRTTIAELQRDAAMAWFERSFQESSRALLLAQIGQAELQAEAAETLYRSGKGTQAEVFAARSAVEQLRDGLASVERQLAVAGTQLERWLGDDARLPLAPRPLLSLPAWAQGALPTAGPTAVPDALPDALSQHPQIAAAVQQEAIASSDAAVARAAKSPDWSVELQYSQRGPAYSNMVSINLSLPLPWAPKNRQDRELAARLAGIDEARARRADLQRAVQAEVQALLQAWRSHEDRLRRYDAALLPLADLRSSAALASYRAGTGPLSAVLDARRSELDVRLERLRIEMDRARVWAQLNYLLPVQNLAQDRTQSQPEATR